MGYRFFMFFFLIVVFSGGKDGEISPRKGYANEKEGGFLQQISSSRGLERACLQTYDHALKCLSQGTYWEGAKNLIIILDYNPGFSKIEGVMYYLGECLYEMELLRAAEKMYKAVIRRNPNSDFLPYAIYGLIKVKYKEGKYQDALDYFEIFQNRFSEVKIRNGVLYYAGQSYFQLKNYEMAIRTFNSVSKDNRFYDFSLYSMGLSYIKKKSLLRQSPLLKR